MTFAPEHLPWLEFCIRLVATASMVVVATWTAERSGPLVGALVATLPISAGPAYVFVAIAHDSAFIAKAALASLAVNAATICFMLAYVVMAQRRGLILSYGAAFVSWIVIGYVVQSLEWSLWAALALNVAVTAVALPIAHRLAKHTMPAARRRWYDVPFRAGLVACFVSFVVALSAHVGPAITGMLAVFPIVLSSLILILQPRAGGETTASLIAHGMFGTVGFGAALVVLHLMAVPFGSGIALGAALAVCIGWNLALLALRRVRT